MTYFKRNVLKTGSVVFCFFLLLGFHPNVNVTKGIQSSEEKEPIHSDIATVYYYGNGVTRIHTWINEENETFKYSGSNGWFSTNKGGYEGEKLYHPVAGDWNGDGLTDMAGFYDYGNGVTRIHVWLNAYERSFDYQSSIGWWESTRGYEAKNVAHAVAGDFNGDGMDDIAGFYDYGDNETRIHIWLSEKTEFEYEGSRGWWSAKGYPAQNVVGAVSGEFADRDRLF